MAETKPVKVAKPKKVTISRKGVVIEIEASELQAYLDANFEEVK